MSNEVQIAETVRRAALGLIQDNYSWGTMLAGVPLLVSDEIKTAATNGKVVKINPDFYLSGTYEFQKFVLGHELLHIALRHVERRRGRDPRLWNIVNDCIVNDMMADYGHFSYQNKPKYKVDGEEVGQGTVYYNDVFGDEQDFHWTNIDSESLYDLLVKEGGEELEKILEGYDFDLQPENGDQDGAGQGEGVEVEVYSKSSEPLSSQDRADKDEVRKSLEQNTPCRGVGLNGETRSLTMPIRNVNQKRNVFSVLDRYMSSTVRYKKNYSRPNRKLYNAGIYYPARYSKSLNDVTMVVDVSGSIIRSEAEDAILFCKKLVKKYRPTNYKVVLFDDQVEWVGTNIPKNLYYGGGTRISSVIPEITSPGLVLVVTDLDVYHKDLENFEDHTYKKGCDVVYLGQSNWTGRGESKYPMVPLW